MEILPQDIVADNYGAEMLIETVDDRGRGLNQDTNGIRPDDKNEFLADDRDPDIGVCHCSSISLLNKYSNSSSLYKTTCILYFSKCSKKIKIFFLFKYIRKIIRKQSIVLFLFVCFFRTLLIMVKYWIIMK